MAYRKDVQRILSGSWNIIAPGTEIPDHDAQNLKNWTYDAVGNLRSRRGHTFICSAGAAVVNMIKGLGARWQAAGGSVFKACAAIISGVSSDYVGLVAWKGFLWAMSRGGQRKSDGTNDWRWIPEAPDDAPTAAAGAEVSTEVIDFSQTDFTVDPAGDEDYTTGKLRITGRAAGTGADADDFTYTITHDTSLDLGTGFSLDDVHRVQVWCKVWKRINEIVFEVDVNDGSFTKDYYTARMRLKQIKIGRKDTITFYLRKRPQNVDVGAKDKKRYGWFDRIGQNPDKDWSTCVAIRIKVDFKEQTRVRFDAWDLVGDEDHQLEGDDIQFCYTYTTDAQHESNPSPFSKAITLNRGSAELTDLVPSADPQVTGMHVYITGGTLQAVYRVTEDPIPAASTSYTVMTNDDALTDLGIQLETDHDDPPEAAVLAGPYYGRLLAASSGANPARLWWTKLNKPFAWPGADDEIGNWVDVGDPDENIMQITIRPFQAMIYKENSVWVLTGDPDGADGENHRTNIPSGISSRQGVVNGGPVDYAHMSEGLYRVDGDSYQKISQKIDPIFKGRTVTIASGVTIPPISDVTTTALGFRDNVLWFSYDSSAGRVSVKYDIESDRWFPDSRGFRSFYYEGQNGFLLGGQQDGSVLALESTTSDNGAGIDLDYFSKYYDQQAPDTEKTYEDLTIEHNTGSQVLTATAFFNNGASSVSLGTFISSSRTRSVFQLASARGVQARNIAVRITGDTTTETVIHELAINHYFEARQGKSWDSDETDFGTHKMKIIRQVHLDLQNTVNASILLDTDQPGFAMTNRDLGIIGAAAARRQEIHVFTSEHLARMCRFVMTGEDFRLYGLRAQIQVIGTYLHGSRREYWRSDPLDFGTERVKLLREIEVVYSTTGFGELKVESDLPSGTLAEVTGSPFALPATVGEETLKIRLPGTFQGRLFQFTVTPSQAPTADIRLEAIRTRVKMIGEPHATPWGWLDLPVEATQDARWVDVFMERDAVG